MQQTKINLQALSDLNPSLMMVKLNNQLSDQLKKVENVDLFAKSAKKLLMCYQFNNVSDFLIVSFPTNGSKCFILTCSYCTPSCLGELRLGKLHL